MEDDDPYFAKIGLLSYRVAGYEAAIFNDPLFHTEVMPDTGLDMEKDLALLSTGQIARKLRDEALKITRADVRHWIETAAEELRKVAVLRNDVIHARPVGTGEDTPDRLMRWTPVDKWVKAGNTLLTDDVLDRALAEAGQHWEVISAAHPDNQA